MSKWAVNLFKSQGFYDKIIIGDNLSQFISLDDELKEKFVKVICQSGWIEEKVVKTCSENNAKYSKT